MESGRKSSQRYADRASLIAKHINTVDNDMLWSMLYQIRFKRLYFLQKMIASILMENFLENELLTNKFEDDYSHELD